MSIHLAAATAEAELVAGLNLCEVPEGWRTVPAGIAMEVQAAEKPRAQIGYVLLLLCTAAVPSSQTVDDAFAVVA